MKAVLDTNVVVSACLWRGAPFQCLAAWARGAFRAAVSPPILAEYIETLAELRLDYPSHRCVDWVAELQSAADLVFPIDRVQGALADPFDEMFLECAISAGADCIVSGDKRHLLPMHEFSGILILSPTDFLKRLS